MAAHLQLISLYIILLHFVRFLRLKCTPANYLSCNFDNNAELSVLLAQAHSQSDFTPGTTLSLDGLWDTHVSAISLASTSSWVHADPGHQRRPGSAGQASPRPAIAFGRRVSEPGGPRMPRWVGSTGSPVPRLFSHLFSVSGSMLLPRSMEMMLIGEHINHQWQLPC